MPLTGRLAALLAIGAATAAPIAGCGSSNDNSTTSSAARQASAPGGGAASGPGGSVSLTATDYKLNPSDPTVKSGKVTFTEKNAGQVTHFSRSRTSPRATTRSSRAAWRPDTPAR